MDIPEGTKPFLLAVGGPSCSGKSTLCRVLLNKLGLTEDNMILTDRVKKEVWKKTHPDYDILNDPLPDYAYTDKEFLHAHYTETARRTVELLKAGKPVVLHATFSDNILYPALRDYTRANNVPFVPVWLSTAHDTLRERLRGRTNETADLSDGNINALEGHIRKGMPTNYGFMLMDSEAATPDGLGDEILRTLLRAKSLPLADDVILDIDDTLYPKQNGIHAAIKERICGHANATPELRNRAAEWIGEDLDFTTGDLSRVFHEAVGYYGARNELAAYNDAVYGADYSAIKPNPALVQAVHDLMADGKRVFIYTNGLSSHEPDTDWHAQKVLLALGFPRETVEKLRRNIWDVQDSIKHGGRKPGSFDAFIEHFEIAPARAIMFDDKIANLIAAAQRGIDGVWIHPGKPSAADMAAAALNGLALEEEPVRILAGLAQADHIAPDVVLPVGSFNAASTPATSVNYWSGRWDDIGRPPPEGDLARRLAKMKEHADQRVDEELFRDLYGLMAYYKDDPAIIAPILYAIGEVDRRGHMEPIMAAMDGEGFDPNDKGFAVALTEQVIRDSKPGSPLETAMLEKYAQLMAAWNKAWPDRTLWHIQRVARDSDKTAKMQAAALGPNVV